MARRVPDTAERDVGNWSDGHPAGTQARHPDPRPSIERMVRSSRGGRPPGGRGDPPRGDGARLGGHRRRRRRQPADRLRHRHRRAERRPHRARRGRGDRTTGRSRHPHVLPRHGQRALHRPRRAPQYAHPRRPRQEDDVRELGCGGGGERREDRPVSHRTERDRDVRPCVPRPHAAHDVVDRQGDALQARHGAVRAGDLPPAVRLPVPMARQPRPGDRRGIGLRDRRDAQAHR